MRRYGLAFSLLSAIGPAVSASRSESERPGPASAQAEPVPGFPAQIEQVTVDAVVTDKDGKPMTGLKEADFTVTEDGVRQPVVSFEAVQLPSVSGGRPAGKLQPSFASNLAPALRTGRTFVIIFDDVHTTAASGLRAKAAIAQFLETGVREGDHVSLVATSGSAWWSARMEDGRDGVMAVLKRLEGQYVIDRAPDAMSEYEAMRIEVYDDQDVGNRVLRRFINQGVADVQQSQSNPYNLSNSSLSSDLGYQNPYVSTRAADVYFKSLSRNRVTLDTLKRALLSLVATKGRKAVILVTDGFIYDRSLDDFKEIIEASRRANAPIYSVDSIGLSGLPSQLDALTSKPIPQQDVASTFMDSTLANEGNDDLASTTGGFSVRNSNDLASGIDRIASESLSYYLLAYNPSNTKQDGRFRKIEVKVNRRDARVRARRGYYASLEGAPTQRVPPRPDRDFQVALDSPYEANDVPLRITSFVTGDGSPGKAKTSVLTEVDIRNLGFKEVEGHFDDTLEYLIVVANGGSGEYWRSDKELAMDLLPATRAKLLATWLPIPSDFELPPGGYQAKMVVRDKNTGKVGTVSLDFEVPALEGLRTSTLILTDRLKPASEENAPSQPVPVARRSFVVGSELYCQFSVLGAAQDRAAGGVPSVSAGYQIRSIGGVVKTQVPPRAIRPTSLGHVSRTIATSLEGFDPGEYEFLLGVRDQRADKMIAVVEPFTVVAVPPAAPAPPGPGSNR